MAVEAGDPAIPNGDIRLVSNPHVWAHVTTEAGTNAVAYREFVEHVLNTYNTIANPALHHTLIQDNLTSHNEAVRERGHCAFVAYHINCRMDQWNMQ